MGRLRKLVSLPPADMLLLVRAWGLFAYVDWVVSRREYGSWPGWMKVEVSTREIGMESVDMPSETASRIIQVTEVAGRNHLVKVNCLRRCIVQRQLLRAHGECSTLRLGVKKERGRLAAHAWLTRGQSLLNDVAANIDNYMTLELADASVLDELR